MRFAALARRLILAAALGLALTATVAACSSSSSSSTSAATSSSAASTAASSSAPASSSTSNAAAQITANWEKFFSASTSTSQRAALLQNGAAFAAAISGLSHMVSGLGATVTNVTVNSPTSATVAYNLTAGGKALLSGQTGKAVYQNGVWKVSDATLCGLVKLVPGASAPAACNSVS